MELTKAGRWRLERGRTHRMPVTGAAHTGLAGITKALEEWGFGESALFIINYI